MKSHNKVNKLAVGKLALTVAAGANASGFGKTDTSEDIGPLTLTEAGVPIEILTPPTNTNSKVTGVGVSEGTLYTELAAFERIDFMISGIRSDKTVYVYLAHSTEAGRSDAWETFAPNVGQLELEPSNMEILGAVVFSQSEYVPVDTKLGKMSLVDETIIMPVNVGPLTDIGLHGEAVYIQAFSFAINDDGSIDWSSAQASEVDKLVINRESQSNQEYDHVSSKVSDNPDDTGSDSGSKSTGSTDTSTDSGSKDTGSTDTSTDTSTDSGSKTSGSDTTSNDSTTDTGGK